MAIRTAYYFQRALKNIRQSPVLSLAAVGTVALALTLLAFFTIAVLNVQQLTMNWSENQAIVAYLRQDPQDHELQKWLQEIQAFPEVSKIEFVSQSEALERFGRRLGEDAGLLSGLDEDVLPASFEIYLHSEQRTPQKVMEVVARLQKDKRFEDLQFGQEWLERFDAFLFLLRITGAAVGGFLVFSALVIVANTIKLTLYARQDELETMALVGGTSLFIKLPYLIEGTLQGLIGGSVALGTSFLLFRVLLQESLGNLLLIAGIDTIHFLPFSWQLALVVAGGGIGLLGSLFALRKFVRIGPS